MKNKILVTTLLAGLSLSTFVVNAQDARFTQYYALPLLINPAVMGANDNLYAGLDYRNQWGSVSSGYSTYALNAMYPIKLSSNEGKLDVGLSLTGDKAGAFGTYGALLAVDYNKEIAEDNHLCLALIGGYGQQSISTSGLTFDDQYVNGGYSSSNLSNENLINMQQGYADVGFGFTWYYNPSRDKSKINAFLGISGYHLNDPNVSLSGSESKLPPRMSYQAGLKLFESNNIDITPNAYMMVQGGNTETALGAYGDYLVNDDLKVTLGLWYRENDAVAILVGFEYKGFTLGYSYDAVTSSLINTASGVSANEITLTYHMGGKSSSSPSYSGSGGNASGSSGSGSSSDSNPSPFPQF